MHVLLLLFQLLCVDLFHAIKFIPDTTASIITNNGISIKTKGSNVNTTATKWIVNPISSINYDISLRISNQWGFSSATTSTLSLKIDGFTPSESKLDGEILLLFSTNNYQYFSVVINLQDNIPWKIYPNDKNSPLATNSDIITNIIKKNNTRWNRLSSNNQWKDIGGSNPYKKDLKWPLNINITNDPINNKVYYKCTELRNTFIEATFDTAFDTNKGLDIYIMNNEIRTKPFHIYSFEIAYTHNTMPSPNATNHVTNSPVLSPTISPNILPTSWIAATSSPTVQHSTEATTSWIATTSSPTVQHSTDATTSWIAATVRHSTDATTSIPESQMDSKPTKMQMQNDFLIYILIATGVAILCFISGIVIGIAIYKRKGKEDVKHRQSDSASITNDESEFKFNIDPELTQQQNELQVEFNRIMLGNDPQEEEKYHEDDEKLIIEEDVTNVMIVQNGLVHRNGDDEVVEKLPTIESIHGNVRVTRSESNHMEGNGHINNGGANFVDR